MYRLLLFLLGIATVHALVPAQSRPQSDAGRQSSIAGHVLLDGEPAKGLKVRISPERMNLSRDQYEKLQTLTDEEGRYKITGLPPGTYQLGIETDEFMLVGEASAGMQARPIN